MPISRLRKTTNKVVKWIKKKASEWNGQALSTTRTVSLLIEFHPSILYSFKRIMIEWGVNVDPVDQRVEAWIVPWLYAPSVSLGTAAQREIIGTDAIWMGKQHWRALGTPATVVDAFEDHDVKYEDDEADFFTPDGYPSFSDDDQDWARYGLVLMVEATITSDVGVSTIIWWEETWIQTNYRDDGDDWDGYEDEEAMADDAGYE